MSKVYFLFFMAFAFTFISCRNKNNPDNEVNPEMIYFDYKITGEEGDDKLTVQLQYRNGGEDGEVLSIQPPGTIMLDGEVMPSDSTKMTGVFYEMYKPITEFTGKHHIVFINSDKKEFIEEFDFQPVSILTSVADTLLRNELVNDPIVFGLGGLDSEDHIRVVLTDTSFEHDGINRVDKVMNGRLEISKKDLENFSSGPVLLKLIREYERPVKNGTKGGGRLQIMYSLKRELYLKN